ncbi:MAG: hypothetical protein CO133_01680, partial [Candidatus Komeilibacteria bacterium CG_4_9_14_3_um_filter_37_5]
IYPENYLQYAEQLKSDLDNALTTKSKRGKKKVITDDQGAKEMEADRIREIAQAYQLYQKILLDNNCLDFGDLLSYTLQLFQKRPNILKKYREQFKYILVDEFQDTNYAQYSLLKLLASPSNNLTVVGDDDQSIYKFRGASIANIMQFKKDFPQAQEVYLINNYRSRQNILDISYQFIQQNNPYRLEVQLGKTNKLSKRLLASSGELGLIEQYWATDLDSEVNWVVNKIISLYNQEPDAKWSDFAILVRANDATRPFQEALDRAELPNYFVASTGLYRQKIVKDIVAYLKCLDNYHESPALWRILNLPFWQLADEQLIKVVHYAYQKQISLYESLSQAPRELKLDQTFVIGLQKIVTLMQKHTTAAKSKKVWEIVYAFLADSGYLAYVNQQTEKEKQQLFYYLNTFYQKIRSWQQNTEESTVKNFINLYNMELESGEQGALSFDPDMGPDTVKLMTIHGSKGLEFKYVFVVNLVEQRFPTIERREPIELPDDLVKEVVPAGDVHVQEERRLFYVAMTRAQQGLFLTGGLDYGGVRKKKPSRFLAELGMAVNNLAEVVNDVQPIAKPDTTKLFTLPKHFSYSQLKTFATCPLQYYYQYVLKMPIKGNASFSYGKSLHNTLQDFYILVKERAGQHQGDLFGPGKTKTIGNLVSWAELVELYERHWLNDWYDDAVQMQKKKKQGQVTLRVYYDSISPAISVPLFLEQEFFCRVGDYKIKGVIDRIDPTVSGQVHIIDYKTGKYKEKLTADDKEQLLIYQIAAQEVLGMQVEQLTYHYLDENKQQSFIGTPRELEKVKQNILEVIEQIKTADFSACPEYHCQYCAFADLCDHQQ